jgi:hypothetical protein
MAANHGRTEPRPLATTCSITRFGSMVVGIVVASSKAASRPRAIVPAQGTQKPLQAGADE